MKCIKVVKETKDNKIGTIRRVADTEADVKVSTGVWAFCPKSEWKLATRKPKNDQPTDQATDQVKVKSKKQLKKEKAEA
jgi:hypothetical protein